MARSRQKAAKPIHSAEAITSSTAEKLRRSMKRRLFTGTVTEEKRVLNKHTKALHDAASRMKIIGKR